jgi:hypothetical protein
MNQRNNYPPGKITKIVLLLSIFIFLGFLINKIRVFQGSDLEYIIKYGADLIASSILLGIALRYIPGKYLKFIAVGIWIMTIIVAIQ